MLGKIKNSRQKHDLIILEVCVCVYIAGNSISTAIPPFFFWNSCSLEKFIVYETQLSAVGSSSLEGVQASATQHFWLWGTVWVQL